MLKLFLFLTIFALYAWGEARVEVYATQMDTKDNIITAAGEVAVVYQDYYLSAKRIRYDKNSGELELFENIHAIQGESMKFLGDYAKLNIAQKERTFKPFYMLEESSDVWLSGAKGYAKDTQIDVTSGVMSGCDSNNPLWKMEFTSSSYDTDSMWLNLYNARIYIYDIPVFYTPYFGYSLDTTRRTGLLPPMVGISSKEGFYYEQSLFIAQDNWWDLELKPQIRTSRGSGVYATYRFVDSKTSKGSLTTGYFKEQNDYFLENNLANKEHFGFDFLYENSDPLNGWFNLNLKGQSGLYVDVSDMNDIEYINLSTNDTTKNATSFQIISRVNLFYNTDQNYLGAYLKYYKDLSFESNEKTLQNIPALHYHSYLNTYLDDHFLYSFDIKSNNYYRELGKNATQTNLNIPLSLQTSMFDEYLNVAYRTNIYAQHTAFRGKEEIPTNDEYSSGLFARNYHMLSASTQLTQAFDSFTHVVDFGSQYVFAGSEMEDGYYKDQKNYCSKKENKNEPICEFYNISEIERNMQLYFSQYVYNSLGEQLIYHRLAQNISYENVDSQMGELENELDYQINESLNYYNNMFYNYDEEAFSKNFNQISYANGAVSAALSHMYKDSFLSKTATSSPIINYTTSMIGYRYDKHYSYHFRYDYDLERSSKKGFEVGFLYQKKCWDFGIRYAENNRPILDRSGLSDSIYDRYVYLTIRLKPIMSQSSKDTGFAYKLPEKSRENR